MISEFLYHLFLCLISRVLGMVVLGLGFFFLRDLSIWLDLELICSVFTEEFYLRSGVQASLKNLFCT